MLFASIPFLIADKLDCGATMNEKMRSGKIGAQKQKTLGQKTLIVLKQLKAFVALDAPHIIDAVINVAHHRMVDEQLKRHRALITTRLILKRLLRQN